MEDPIKKSFEDIGELESATGVKAFDYEKENKPKENKTDKLDKESVLSDFQKLPDELKDVQKDIHKEVASLEKAVNKQAEKEIKYYGIGTGKRYRSEKNGYIYKIIDFPAPITASDPREVLFGVEVRTPAGALFIKETDLAKLLKQLESGNFKDIGAKEYISHETQIKEETKLKGEKKKEKKESKEKKEGEKEIKKEQGEERAEQKDQKEKIEEIDEVIKVALKEANKELEEARKRFVETEQEYLKFKGLLGSIKGVVLSEGKTAVTEEYKKAKATYEQMKRKILSGYVDKLLAERIKLIDLKSEKMAENKSWYKKAYKAYKKLGEYNLEKVIKPKNRLAKFATRMVSARTGVSLALFGVATLSGGGIGVIGALTARRIFGGVGVAVGSYDLMDNFARRGELKKSRMVKLPKEEIEKFSDKELEEHLGFFEADALLTEEKLSENKSYKKLLKEYRDRIESKRVDKLEKIMEGDFTDLDKAYRKAYDKLKFNKNVRKGIAASVGVFVGSGALYEVLGKPAYEAVAEPLHETKRYVTGLLWGEEVDVNGVPVGGVKETASFMTKEIEPGKNMSIDPEGGISYKYDQSFWGDKIDSPDGVLAEIQKGEGMTHAISRQVELWGIDDLREAGYKGVSGDSSAIHEFAVNKAKEIAIEQGYINIEAGEEIWVRQPEGIKNYYFLNENGSVDHVFTDANGKILGEGSFVSPAETVHSLGESSIQETLPVEETPSPIETPEANIGLDEKIEQIMEETAREKGNLKGIFNVAGERFEYYSPKSAREALQNVGFTQDSLEKLAETPSIGGKLVEVTTSEGLNVKLPQDSRLIQAAKEILESKTKGAAVEIPPVEEVAEAPIEEKVPVVEETFKEGKPPEPAVVEKAVAEGFSSPIIKVEGGSVELIKDSSGRVVEMNIENKLGLLTDKKLFDLQEGVIKENYLKGLSPIERNLMGNIKSEELPRLYLADKALEKIEPDSPEYKAIQDLIKKKIKSISSRISDNIWNKEFLNKYKG